MHYFLTTLMIMTTMSSMAKDGKASTIKKTFSRQTKVSIAIDADAAIVWALLTNAGDFPRWNSTITSLEGKIQLGEKIRLKSTLDDKRTFKIKVKEFVPEKRMVWGDGKGKRIFTLSPEGEGKLRFSMDEKMGGLMFPLYAKYIPPFDEAFEQFASDLKKEAETIQSGTN